MAEELKKFTRWLLGWALVAWVVVTCGMLLTGIDRDDSDPENTGQRSGLTVYTDHRTGCQYLSTGKRQALTPRNGADYEQVGCRYKEHK